MARRQRVDFDDGRARESYRSLQWLPDESIEDRLRLEGAVQWWESQLDTAKWPRAMDWFRNHAFVAGNHYPHARWIGATVSAENPSLPPNRIDQYIPRTVDNQLIRAFEQNISLLTDRKPKPRVEPNSEEPEDEDSAELAKIVYQLLYERTGMPVKQRSLAGMLCAQGTSAVETVYEETDIPLATAEMAERETDDSLLTDEQGRPMKTRRFEPTGKNVVTMKRELQARLWNAFELQPDPGATELPESITWIMRRDYIDRHLAKELYDRDEEGYHPERIRDVSNDRSVQSPLYYWERVKDILDQPEALYGLTGLPITTQGGISPDLLVRNVVDVRPSRAYPMGRTLILIGGSLVYSGPARAWTEKYPDLWHRYSIYRYWTMPGRFWGMPLLSFLVPLQRRINAIDSLVQLNREFMVIGQWLVPSTARVPAGVLGGLPGIEIPYKVSTTGAKPERVPHVPLPADLLLERDRCVRSIETIAGVERALEGEGNSAVRAGVMLDFIKRQQLFAKSTMIQNYNGSLETSGQHMLIEVGENLRSEDPELSALVRAATRDHSTLAIQTFVGSDLRDNVRIKLDIGSELLETPEAKKQLVLDFAQYIRREWTPEEIAAIAKAIGFTEFEKKDSLHVSRARKLVSRIKSGFVEFAFPLPVDDPGIFADVIRNEMLRDSFHDAPQAVKQALFQLLMYYEQQLAERTEAMRQRQVVDAAMLAMANKGMLPPGAGASGGEAGAGAGLRQPTPGGSPESRPSQRPAPSTSSRQPRQLGAAA